MKNILTAEEFFEQSGTYPELAIEFAKLHVQKALKLASEIVDNELEKDFLTSELILNAYPLENII